MSPFKFQAGNYCSVKTMSRLSFVFQHLLQDAVDYRSGEGSGGKERRFQYGHYLYTAEEAQECDCTQGVPYSQTRDTVGTWGMKSAPVRLCLARPFRAPLRAPPPMGVPGDKGA